eukprot:673171-Rhodomonas_salina.1
MTDPASEDFFDWKGRYEDLPMWKCQCCNNMQFTCPITLEEYSFCGKKCAEEYMRFYQYERRPTEADSGTRWCRCCRKIQAYEDFE